MKIDNLWNRYALLLFNFERNLKKT